MRLYVHMLLCGSACTLLYILLKSIPGHELPLKYRRIFLRANIAFHLLPLPWLVAEMKLITKQWLEKAGITFREFELPDVLYTDSIWSSILIVDNEGTIYLATGYQKWTAVIVLAGIAFLLLLFLRITAYLRTCEKCKKVIISFPEAEGGGYRHVGRKKVRVGISPYVPCPVAVGIISPVMLLPANYKEYTGSMEGIIRHEMNHISGKDMIGRLLTFLVVAFEWFNPLAHYLMKEELAVSEMLCDEAAVEGMTDKEKKSYMECILRAAEEPGIFKEAELSLGTVGKLLNKRMERIMKKSMKRRWKRKTAVLIMAACFIVSCIPAFAYQRPLKYGVTEEEDKTVEKWNTIDRMTFISEEEGVKEYLDFSRGDIVFVDEDGMVWEEGSFLTGNSGQERESCQHSYKSGTIVEHNKKTDGSCTETTYSAQKCTRCGYVLKGSRISTTTYDKCPH